MSIKPVTVLTVFIEANKPLKRLGYPIVPCVPALKRGVNDNFADGVVLHYASPKIDH